MTLDEDRRVWDKVKFGEVVRNVNDNVKDPAFAGITRALGLEHLDPGELHTERWGDVSPELTFTRRVRPGQTLFGKRRSYQRKTAYAEFDAVCSADILVFESADTTRLLPELLPFIAMTDAFYAMALETSAGSLSPRTRWSDIAKHEFVLPPLKQQRKIARMLWAAEAHHREQSRLLKLMRRVSLAFAQELFASTEERTSVADLGRDGAQTVQVGPFGGSLASRHFRPAGVGVLKINNLTNDGELDSRELVFVDPDYALGLSRYLVEPGDLLVAAQATVGRVALVPETCPKSLISQHLIRVRVEESKLDPRVLHLLFRSEGVQKQMLSVKTKSTRDGLNTDDVANFDLPRLSLERQDSALTLINELGKAEARQETALAALLELRRVLLNSGSGLR